MQKSHAVRLHLHIFAFHVIFLNHQIQVNGKHLFSQLKTLDLKTISYGLLKKPARHNGEEVGQNLKHFPRTKCVHIRTCDVILM